MSVASEVKIIPSFVGDLNYGQQFNGANGVVGSSFPVLLSSGDTTVTIPTGSLWVIIVPLSTNTEILKIKGVGGDTGILIAKTYPTLISLTTTTTLVINCGGATTIRFIFG